MAAVEKGDKFAVLADLLDNGSAGRRIPADVLAGTNNDMRQWINQTFKNYQGDIAVVTANRLFERKETRTSDTTEK